VEDDRGAATRLGGLLVPLLAHISATDRPALLDEFHMTIYFKFNDYAKTAARHESVIVATVVRVFL